MAASNLTLNIGLGATGLYENTGTAYTSTTKQVLAFSYSKALTFGTALNQADLLYCGSGTVNSTGSNLDLAGSLVDTLGNTLTFAEVVLLVIENTETTDGRNLLVGGGTNAFFSFVANTSDILSIPTSGCAIFCAPAATAYAVTAGTADILKLASASAGYTCGYKIMIAGRSA